MPLEDPFARCIQRIPSLALTATTQLWPVAVHHAASIAEHWQRRQSANPAFFDGEVFVLRSIGPGETCLEATLSLERFSAFLYWRDGLSSDLASLDVFCTAVVRSAEGHVMMGLSGPSTLNAGRVYFPGGFLDRRDLRPDGSVDLDGAVARELAEETGLNVADLSRVDGYVVTRHGRFCSLGIEFRSPLGSQALARVMRAGLAGDPDRELADVVIVARREDVAELDVVEHARYLLTHLLAQTCSD